MSEDLIWSIINNQFCSFKAKFEAKTFCQNEYNLTGICSKTYCPLSNGRYATIKEEDGVLYLYIKTIERSHMPAKLWEKIPLPEDMAGALAIIRDQLAFWPKPFVNKVKERLVRLHQYLLRYRKWYYRAKPRLVTVHKKFERREQKRELKALVAAKLDFAIKNELLDRLKQGTYEPFINLNNKAYTDLLREEKRRQHLKMKADGKFRGVADVDQALFDRAEKLKRDQQEGEEEDESEALQFVEADDDEEFPDVEDMGEVDMDNFGEDEEEDEQEADLEDDGNDELREDILKHIPINLHPEAGDDEEMKRLKKRLLLKRKRKLEQKHEDEKKQAKKAQKKRHYGAHVEIEYEPSTTTQTTTSTSSSSSSW